MLSNLEIQLSKLQRGSQSYALAMKAALEVKAGR